MGLLKEGIRRSVPLLFSAAFITCGSGKIVVNHLVDCHNGPFSVSKTEFVRKGQEINVNGLPMRSSSTPGKIVIILSEIDKDTSAIEFDDKGISFTRTDKSRLPWSRETKTIYVISAKPGAKDDVLGTELTIQATCETPEK